MCASREEEVSFALGVADKLEVAVFRTQRLEIILLADSQQAPQVGKYRACKGLHGESLHRNTASVKVLLPDLGWRNTHTYRMSVSDL